MMEKNPNTVPPHVSLNVFTATSVTSFKRHFLPADFLSLLCVGGCFSGSSAKGLLAVYARFDLLFVIIFRKGIPEEAEDL